MRLLLVAMILVLLMQPGIAQDSGYTGHYYLEICNPVPKDDIKIEIFDELDESWCTGFILGATKMLRASRELGNPLICIPKKTDARQLFPTFVKRLHERPERLHMDVGGLFFLIMVEIYPCESE